MTQEMLIRLHETLDELEQRNLFAGKEIVIFGSNEPAERMIEYFAGKGRTVSFLVDNNEKKTGTTVHGIPVYFPKDALLPKKERIVILIASRFYSEMVAQLDVMGYTEQIEVWNAFCMDWKRDIPLTEEKFDSMVDAVANGGNIYETLLAEHDYPEKMFLCKVPALGDIYLAYAFMKQYIEKCKINSYRILVPKGPFVKLAELFDLAQYVIALDDDSLWLLSYYAVFVQMENGGIEILNHKFPYTRRIGELGNYCDICFTDMFRYGIFGLPHNSKPEVPMRMPNAEEYVNGFFEKNGLVQGKTAILMPYAKTSSQLNVTFWERLSEILIEKGYTVCTNSGGDMEPVIKNTKGVFFDIRYGTDIVEAAGVVIGLRSGLLDVISSAKAKKIILYPNRIYGVGTFFDYYNLHNMQLSKDAVELIWDETEDSMLDKVVSSL